MKQVLILSDTHGHVDENILQIANRSDYVVHAGDICGAHVLHSLKPKEKVIAVRGNNDHPSIWTAQERAMIESIPEEEQLKLPGGLLSVEHGHRHDFHRPSHDDLRNSHPTARLIVYGHTHKQVFDQEKQPWVVNPGAAGHTRTRGGPSCVVLIATETDWHIELKRFPQNQVA